MSVVLCQSQAMLQFACTQLASAWYCVRPPSFWATQYCSQMATSLSPQVLRQLAMATHAGSLPHV